MSGGVSTGGLSMDGAVLMVRSMNLRRAFIEELGFTSMMSGLSRKSREMM